MEDDLGEKEDDQESGRNQEDKEEEAVWMLDPSDTQNFFSHEPQQTAGPTTTAARSG